MTDGASIRDLERRLAAAPASPLFARLAAALLSHGEIARAESLCERGVGLYPRYATGRLVHARCLAARGRYAEALEALEAVEAGYPGNIVLDGLAEEWRALAGARVSVDATDDGAVFTDLPAGGSPVDLIADDAAEPPAPDFRVQGADIGVADPAPGIPVAVIEVAPPAPGAPSGAADVPAASAGYRDRAVEAEIAVSEAPAGDASAGTPASDAVPAAGAMEAPASVETSTPPRDPETRDTEGVDPPAPVPMNSVGTVPILQPVPRPFNRTSFIGQDRIVSRTLAEIYASQGAIGEAVETYRILLEMMPERSGQLGGRLKELEEKLRTDPGPRPVREE